MDMAAVDTSCLVGPVPFKDVDEEYDGGETVISPAEEYADIVSALPSIGMGPGRQLRQYQGVWLIGHMISGVISAQRRFVPRSGNVVLASPPKCGTTWIKAMSFATMARATYPPASPAQGAKLEALPSPRLLHTHMHHSMLPRALADCSKIVFVCREPKDMLVSMWHIVRSGAGASDFPFSALFDPACRGQNLYGPIWDHLLGYWPASRAGPGRVLFLRYEEMLARPVSTVGELARFLGVPFTAAGSPVAIAEMCSIDALRGLDANKTGNTGLFVKCSHQSFFRKGVAGDWANHMTPEMARRIDAIVHDKLRGSGLTFTS